MNVRFLVVVFVIAFAMIVPVGAFLGVYHNSQASPGSTILRMGFMDRIDALNPYIGLSETSNLFYSLVYDSLMGVGEDLNPVPCLAQEWRIVPTEVPYGSVWEYNVSAGAMWSDDVPVTAEDVAYSLNVNSGVNYTMVWAYQPYAYYIDFARVMDGDTVWVHFYNRTSDAPMPIAFGDSILIPMLPKHILETMTVPYMSFSWNGMPVVGSGPFIPTPTLLNDWMAGDPITLVRNTNYHGGPNYGRYVQFDKIEMHFYDDSAAMVTALKNNELDVAKLPFEAYVPLRNEIDLGLVEDIMAYDGPRPDGYWENILVNMKFDGPNPSRLDPDIRHAMAMATDKNYILLQFYLGEGVPGSTLIAPVSDWHYDLGVGEEIVYDIDAANNLLDSSGYIDSNSDGIRECTATSYAVVQGYVSEGTLLSYQMIVRREHPEEKEIAQFLKDEWAKIGISLQFDIVDEFVLSTMVYSYSYDTAIWFWSMDPDPNYILFTQSKRSWNGWSDTLYSSPTFENNYNASVTELNLMARQTYVDNCQSVHYQDTPYIIFAYLNHTYAWRTDTFSGWGDWDSYPGRSITAAWSGNPLYFELVTTVEYNYAPTDVSVSSDPAFGPLGTKFNLTVNAFEPDGDDLSIYIEFGDGTADQAISSAPMYAEHEAVFAHFYPTEGAFHVTVWVDDGSGTPECNVSDSVTVWVLETGSRSISYHWYNLFNVPTGEWWDTRWAVYGIDEPLTSGYPFIIRTHGPPLGNDLMTTSMRLDIFGSNVTEINTSSWSEFLPMFGEERGGNILVDWYMQYLTSADLVRYPSVVGNNSDGWMNVLNGTVTLDRQAAKTVMGITDADIDSFAAWWASNNATFNQDYLDWLDYEANVRLDIYNMYDYPFVTLYATIDAEKVDESVVLTYDIVSWGMDCMMARWLNEAFLPSEYFFEDFSLDAAIAVDSADFAISTAVEYAAYAWETTLVPGSESNGQPCWVWEPSLGDCIPSQTWHPGSDFDPYVPLGRMCKSPCSVFWHQYLPYDYTPAAWNLSAGETLSLEWPATIDVPFYSHDSFWPLDPVEVNGTMTVRYSEPMEMDFPGQVVNNRGTGLITFTGPIDMWTWSRNQIKHEALSDEWVRLGVLPQGMPWIEFQLDSGLNTPPTALFDFDPEFGDVFTDYAFIASDSWDLEDAVDTLEVRWDWESDGTYDTGWSTVKTENHQFTTAGTYNVTVEVRDSQGLTDTEVIQVVVVELIPEIPAVLLPVIAVVLSMVVFRARHRRC